MTAAPAAERVPALDLRDLEIVYRVRGRDREVVRGISFTIDTQRNYGLVGESGCGKSTVALAIVRYLPRNGRVTGGTLHVAGRDVLALGGEALRGYHRDVVSMVLRQGTRLAIIGVVIGLVSAHWLTRVLARVLYEVTPTDPLSHAAAAIMLGAVAAVATYLPARRAATVDPVVALRDER